MSAATNALNWFEIAVTDLVRATKFYEMIFDIKMIPADMPRMKMALFPTDYMSGKVGGALVQSEVLHPSAKGTLVHLNANPDLKLVQDQLEKAGGKVTLPKTLITDKIGYKAFFIDTEGNALALHSSK